VPWSSTLPEPESPPEPARKAIPRLEPEDDDRPRRRSIPVDDKDDWEPPPLRSRPRKEPRRINPKYCLIHDEKASEHACKDCGLQFCSSCVVTFQGETLCGPCKNFRLRSVHRPIPISQWAIFAAIAGLVSAPIGFCATLWGMVAENGSGGTALGVAVLGTLIGFVFPLAALIFGAWSLRQIEKTPNLGGRFLAITGTMAGLVGTLWSATIGLILILKAT
jgi:hypothetical protein